MHDEFLWMEIVIPIDSKLIDSITGLPAIGEDINLLTDRSQEKALGRKMDDNIMELSGRAEGFQSHR